MESAETIAGNEQTRSVPAVVVLLALSRLAIGGAGRGHLQARRSAVTSKKRLQALASNNLSKVWQARGRGEGDIRYRRSSVLRRFWYARMRSHRKYVLWREEMRAREAVKAEARGEHLRKADRQQDRWLRLLKLRGRLRVRRNCNATFCRGDARTAHRSSQALACSRTRVR